jgi:peptide/nickel transport system substrate-binding protein
MNRKYFVFSSLLVILSLLLAGCGSTVAPAATKAPEPTASLPEATKAPEPTASLPEATKAPEPTASLPEATKAPEPTQQPAKSELANTLVVAHAEAAYKFDPIIANWWDVGRVMMVAYDSLVRYDPIGKQVIPWLVKEWEISDDGLTYTFKLNQGVKFHDGTDLTSSDVKYTMERTMTIGEDTAAYLADVKSIEAVDDYTVKITLSAPSNVFLTQLTQIFILSEEGAKAHEVAGDLAQGYLVDHELGSGPYELVENVPDQKATFKRFDGYWKGWTGDEPDGVVFLWIKESATQQLMLEKGDIDIMMNPTWDNLAGFGDKPGYVVLKGDSPMIYGVNFRVIHKPLDDIRVRKALEMAVDYDYFVNVALGGYAQQAQGPMGRGMPYHNDDIPLVTYDIEAAKQLLAEAGYPGGGFTLKVAYESGQEDSVRMFDSLQASWGELGVQVEAMGMDWASESAMAADPKSEPDVHLTYTWPDFPHPGALRVYFHSDSLSFGSNMSYWSDPAVDKLFDGALVETDPTKQAQSYKEIQQRIFDAHIAAWVSEEPYYIIARDYVKGYVYNPSPHQSLDVYHMRIEGKP